MSDEDEWEDEESEEEWYEEDSAAEDVEYEERTLTMRQTSRSLNATTSMTHPRTPNRLMKKTLAKSLLKKMKRSSKTLKKNSRKSFMQLKTHETKTLYEEYLTTDDLIDEDQIEPGDYGNTWAVSLCFWLSLTVSGSMYGAVALSPKLAVWMSARHEFRENSRQLAALEDKVEYLERVCHALDTDPDFLQRMSQASGAVIRSSDGSELIPVSGDLLFGYGETATVTNAVSEPTRSAELARLVGSHGGLRTSLLLSASLLTIFALRF